MGYLLGTDEAGYGPNLGPLVISATVWEAPDGVGAEDLFGCLQRVISSTLDGLCAECGPFVAMADSKALYAPAKGLCHLERGVWAALGVLGHRPKTWRKVFQAIAPEALLPMPSIPWYADYDSPAPLECDGADIASLVALLREGLEAAGVRLLAVRSRVVFEEEFNALIERDRTKGDALSNQTLALAASLIAELPPGPVSMICDKHGGRDYYAALLSEHFPEWFVEVRREGRAKSVYRFGPPERRVEVCFRTDGEECLPTALASMASKYLRELAMRAVNSYWCGHVPGLQPTAGYPQDARRFRADIAAMQTKLRIADRMLWRVR